VAYVKNKQQVERNVRKSMDKFKKRLGQGIADICMEADETIKSMTPVWSGLAVRNYIWTIGAPASGVIDPINNGPPGPTNSMALGAEPRRDANEAASRETLLALDFSNPFQTFTLVNNAPTIAGLEYGLLPTPEQSRSPNGMFGQTQNYISEYVRSKGIAR
jgi:hypothetical protein